jgi:hypothetical protein
LSHVERNGWHTHKIPPDYQKFDIDKKFFYLKKDFLLKERIGVILILSNKKNEITPRKVDNPPDGV